jgi:glycosyltransferase involved in cell wall biosynthesis
LESEACIRRRIIIAGDLAGGAPAAGAPETDTPIRCHPSLHVGLNLVFLAPGESGGMEIYARELIPKLVAAAPEYRFTAFVNQDAQRSDGPWNGLIGSVVVPVRTQNRIEWVRGEQQLLPPLAQRAGVQLLHSLASTAPAWGRFRRVVTIHDLIYRLVPESHPGVRSLGMRILVPLAARRSDRIIVDSNSTREDLLRFVSVSDAKVDVVPLGLGTARAAAPLPEGELRARLGAGDRQIVLSVSAKRAHKNLIRLIDALALIPAPSRPLLVLPGYHTAYEEQLKARVAELRLSEDVKLLGWVSAEELEGLYAAATCFVFPSLAEGFGLPVLEAMSRGVPVACSGRGSLAEVAGDAALLFDPESVTSIAAAITQLLEDRTTAARLRAAGTERAARFSWETTAAQTLASYERAVANV